MNMQRLLSVISVTAAIVALAVAPGVATAQTAMAAAPLVTLFSSQKAGSALPAGWEVAKITDDKKPTVYALVDDGGVVVLNAKADAAASGLGYATKFDLRSAPVMEWRWKVKNLIAGADNAVGSKEDSPVRIVLYFDGDRAKLPLKDRIALSLGDSRAGHPVAYAVLMYVWSNKVPVGTVIPNPHTSRVQMVVASSGPAGVGAWQSLKRNAVEDFRRAYGEDPGTLISVGVLTDTDNTGENVEAWYGDIRFLPAAP